MTNKITSEVAMDYLNSGLSVLPASKERKQPTIGSWKPYQERLPSFEEVKTLFSSTPNAICIVLGKVSGNLEVIDFDNGGELFSAWEKDIPKELFDKLVIETTQSGGFHVAYRCESEICGNIKLAQGQRDGKLKTLIETRGEGGIILCSPSSGYELIQGEYTNLPVITEKERVLLLQTAWALNENKKVVDENIETTPIFDPTLSSFEQRPGDDFNNRPNAKEFVKKILLSNKWTHILTLSDGKEYWQRPNKSNREQHSAILNSNGYFYNYSSNATPFSQNQGYSPFSVYALLNHNGDFNMTAKDLLNQGFGKPTDDSDVDLSALLGNNNTPLAPKQEKQLYNACELLQEYVVMKEPLIDGLLRREEVMNIVAAPKTGKSWLVMHLALCLITGRDWFGRACTKSKVLLIDNELHKETIACRLKKVAQSMNIPLDSGDIENLTIFPQRGTIKDLKQLGTLNNPNFDVIVIDALYKALPKEVDENSNGQITGVYNDLDKYAHIMKSAIILVHHTSKGNQGNKSITDVGSGAGAQSRSPDTHLTLRPHEADGVVSVFCCVRSFPPMQPFCLQKNEDNLWELASDYDPNELDGKEKELSKRAEKRNLTVEDIAFAIETNLKSLELPKSKTSIVEAIREKANASKSKTESALELLCEKNILEVRMGERSKNQQAMKCYYYGRESEYYVAPKGDDIKAKKEFQKLKTR